MDGWWGQATEAVRQEFADVPNVGEAVRITIRLTLAAVLGGVLGMERSHAGKPAGLRTYMLVSLGSAAFVIVPLQAGMRLEDLSRVIQGLVAGIGFIGAGAILKQSSEKRVRGVTTAAGLWLTAAVGMAAGMGRPAAAFLTVLLAYVILAVLGRLEGRMKRRPAPQEKRAEPPRPS
jgi:putative Mg2+ transporter-C (MgtC) family protein